MKKLLALLATLLVLTSMTTGDDKPASSAKQFEAFGVAFYNLENLFDTINSNGTYDKEFSPQGARQWNTEKYYKKLHNLAYAISQMATNSTPNGPALIGVSEIENIEQIDRGYEDIENRLNALGAKIVRK